MAYRSEASRARVAAAARVSNARRQLNPVLRAINLANAIDWSGLDGPLVAMRLAGKSWKATADDLGVGRNTARDRMRALVSDGLPLAVIAPKYAKRGIEQP